jgi:hypothetical protein
VRGADLDAFAVGPRFTGPVFARGDQGCVAFDGGSALAFFAVGPALGADAEAAVFFPALGEGRLALRHAADEGGAPLSAALAALANQPPFVDRTLAWTARPCAPPARGCAACPPHSRSGAPTPSRYAACTRPLYRCDRACEREEVIRLDRTACLEGPQALALHHLGPEVREGIFEDDAKLAAWRAPTRAGFTPSAPRSPGTPTPASRRCPLTEHPAAEATPRFLLREAEKDRMRPPLLPESPRIIA